MPYWVILQVYLAQCLVFHCSKEQVLKGKRFIQGISSLFLPTCIICYIYQHCIICYFVALFTQFLTIFCSSSLTNLVPSANLATSVLTLIYKSFINMLNTVGSSTEWALPIIPWHPNFLRSLWSRTLLKAFLESKDPLYQMDRFGPYTCWHSPRTSVDFWGMTTLYNCQVDFFQQVLPINVIHNPIFFSNGFYHFARNSS